MIQANSPKSAFIRKGRTKQKSEKQSNLMNLQNSKFSTFRSSLKSGHASCHLQPRSALVCNYTQNSKQHRILFEKCSTQKRQIASLTKMMTLLLGLQFIQQNFIVPEQQFLIVSKEAASLGGTSACLEAGDKISLWDLFHGLMLPSGNDAALCIAQYIDNKLKNVNEAMYQKTTSNFRISSSYKKYRYSKKKVNKSESIDGFIQKMNQKAKYLGMNDTYYANPHGLNDERAFSTAYDQMILISYCMKNQLFRKIVKTKLYFGSVQQVQSGWTREMLWENTNRLLYNGYEGIKTGNTVYAKYCLAAWYRIPEKNINIITIVLGCENKQSRDKHTLSLTKLGIKLITQQLANKQFKKKQNQQSADFQ